MSDLGTYRGRFTDANRIKAVVRPPFELVLQGWKFDVDADAPYAPIQRAAFDPCQMAIRPPFALGRTNGSGLGRGRLEALDGPSSERRPDASVLARIDAATAQ